MARWEMLSSAEVRRVDSSWTEWKRDLLVELRRREDRNVNRVDS